VTLIEDLQRLGEGLGPQDQPANLHQVVGALVKVLEDSGTTVPDSLFPPDPEVAERERLKARLAELEDEKKQAAGAKGSTK
jgi:hypothetical protein